MRINTLIKKLEILKKEYGNVEVIEIYEMDNEHFVEEIKKIEFNSNYQAVAIIIK